MYVDFDSGKVGFANHTQLIFQEATHLPLQAEYEFAEFFTEKNFQLDFSK